MLILISVFWEITVSDSDEHTRSFEMFGVLSDESRFADPFVRTISHIIRNNL